MKVHVSVLPERCFAASGLRRTFHSQRLRNLECYVVLIYGEVAEWLKAAVC